MNSEYASKMDEIVGAQIPANVNKERFKQKTDDEIKIQRTLSRLNLRPKLVSIPDGSEISPKEAADLLGKHLPTLHVEEDSSEISKTIPSTVIKTDKYETSRFKFVFVDISAGVEPRKRNVLVREPKGALRNAVKSERLYVARRVWGRNSKKYLK